MKKFKFSKVMLLVIFVFVIGVFSFFYKSYEKVDAPTAPSYERYRPEDPIVSFFLEPNIYENVILGDEIESSLYVDTKGKDIYSFEATYKYFGHKSDLVDYTVMPALRDKVTVDDTHASYIEFKSTKLDNPLNGDKIKLVSIRIKPTKEGMGFFDLSKGSLKTIDENGKNIADIYDVKKVKYNVMTSSQ